MQIEIIGKKGRTLRSINHGGQTYIEAPAQGEYKIRLRNTSGSRRLAIVSVDGVNVLDGKDAGFDGRGYVLRPWETIDIPGWLRSDSKVAKFEFKEQGGSYAAQTGRGTSNVGVIGVAVYDEKVQVYAPVYAPTLQLVPVGIYKNSESTITNYGGSSCGVVSSQILRAESGVNPEDRVRGYVLGAKCEPTLSVNAVQDVGTGYGHEASFYTETTTFNRATVSPALVLSVRYATRERLLSWGVPLDQPKAPMTPNPFPSLMSAVPAPPGWRG